MKWAFRDRVSDAKLLIEMDPWKRRHPGFSVPRAVIPQRALLRRCRSAWRESSSLSFGLPRRRARSESRGTGTSGSAPACRASSPRSCNPCFCSSKKPMLWRRDLAYQYRSSQVSRPNRRTGSEAACCPGTASRVRAGTTGSCTNAGAPSHRESSATALARGVRTRPSDAPRLLRTGSARRSRHAPEARSSPPVGRWG